MRGGHDTRRAAERLRGAETDALRFLARAAALMSAPDPKAKGEALYWAGLASLRIAQSDPDQAAYDHAMALIAAFSPPRAPVVPGPYSGT